MFKVEVFLPSEYSKTNNNQVFRILIFRLFSERYSLLEKLPHVYVYACVCERVSILVCMCACLKTRNVKTNSIALISDMFCLMTVLSFFKLRAVIFHLPFRIVLIVTTNPVENSVNDRTSYYLNMPKKHCFFKYFNWTLASS